MGVNVPQGSQTSASDLPSVDKSSDAAVPVFVPPGPITPGASRPIDPITPHNGLPLISMHAPQATSNLSTAGPSRFSVNSDARTAPVIPSTPGTTRGEEQLLPPAKKLKMTHTEEKLLACDAYALKFNLSQSASKCLVDLVNACMGSSEEKLKAKPHSPANVKVLDICTECHSLYPEDGDVRLCPQNGCKGKRFKNDHLKVRKNYFAYTDVGDQIRSVLEKDGIWEEVVKYRKECDSVQDDIITDVCTASRMKELRKEGAFLSDPHNLSTLANTDGVPVYISSSVSIRPVYLVLNELPPHLRFARCNMILWGVWQGNKI